MRPGRLLQRCNLPPTCRMACRFKWCRASRCPSKRLGHSTASHTRFLNTRKLFFGRRAGEGCGYAQRNEHAAGDVALGAHPAWVAPQAVSDRAGERGPEAVAERSHTCEENAEGEDLGGDVSSRWIDELWEKGEEEEGGFWIEDVDDDALGEDASEGGALCIGRGVEGFVVA